MLVLGMHKIELSNPDYHYVSELLANRANEIQTKLNQPICTRADKDAYGVELLKLESLLSEKFISI